MKKLPHNLFHRVEIVAKTVLSDLKKKGHVVPLEQQDGSLKFDNFTVRKVGQFYCILDKRNQVVIEQINLPQTAALLASGLALGKILDSTIIKLDQEYGFKKFDEEVYYTAAKRKKNTLDQVIYYETRYQTAKLKRAAVRNKILESFRKLTSIR
jgi:hypothetical protein